MSSFGDLYVWIKGAIGCKIILNSRCVVGVGFYSASVLMPSTTLDCGAIREKAEELL